MKNKIFFLLVVLISLDAKVFQREIITPKVEKPTVVKFEIDNHILQNSNLTDLEIKEGDKALPKSIKKVQIRVGHYNIFTPIAYERGEVAELIFQSSKVALINKIDLTIQNRNFKTYFDLYIQNQNETKLIVKNYPIFDYSSELGFRNFTIKLNYSIKADKIILKYNTKKSEFFYKYRDYERVNRFLTIKRVSTSNQKAVTTKYNYTQLTATKKDNEYIFETKNLPFSRVKIVSEEKNYDIIGTLYSSNDKKKWVKLKSFSLLNSTFINGINRDSFDINYEKKTEYLKIKFRDKEFEIESISIAQIKKELFFIANSGKKYSLFYALEKIKNSNSIDSIVSKNDIKNAQIVTLQEPKEIIKKEKKLGTWDYIKKYKTIFLTVIVLLSSAFLLFIVVNLIKKEQN